MAGVAATLAPFPGLPARRPQLTREARQQIDMVSIETESQSEKVETLHRSCWPGAGTGFGRLQYTIWRPPFFRGSVGDTGLVGLESLPVKNRKFYDYYP